MRKILTGLGLAFFLTLAPAAISGPAVAADTPVTAISQSQATPAPQPQPQQESSGNQGLWGLLGLAGLLGLMGMRKQREHERADHVRSTHPRP